SGNQTFWKTRWENSIDGTGTPMRTLVTYKETQANAKIDPNAAWTGTWRDPAVANLAPGAVQTITAGCSCILGHEWDEDLDNGFRPAGVVRMSSTTANVPFYIQDYGSVYAPGTATHTLTLYRAPSNALVFGAGTVNWSWALDGLHDGTPSTPDLNIQQATVNLLADMGAQPTLPLTT